MVRLLWFTIQVNNKKRVNKWLNNFNGDFGMNLSSSEATYSLARARLFWKSLARARLIEYLSTVKAFLLGWDLI